MNAQQKAAVELTAIELTELTNEELRTINHALQLQANRSVIDGCDGKDAERDGFFLLADDADKLREKIIAAQKFRRLVEAARGSIMFAEKELNDGERYSTAMRVNLICDKFTSYTLEDVELIVAAVERDDPRAEPSRSACCNAEIFRDLDLHVCGKCCDEVTKDGGKIERDDVPPPLTSCCGATATYSDATLVCKNCFAAVDANLVNVED